MYLDGQVFLQGSAEAPGHAAVVCGVCERRGAQDVVQQVAGQSVALLTAQPQGQLQNLHQLRAVRQELFSIHTGNLRTNEEFENFSELIMDNSGRRTHATLTQIQMRSLLVKLG